MSCLEHYWGLLGSSYYDRADWWTGGRNGVRNPGRGGLERTGGLADAADYGIQDGADWGRRGADWGGRGGLVDGRTGGLADGADYRILDRADWGGRGGGGRIGSSLEGRKGRIGKHGVGVPADWANRLGCARLGQLPSSHLRAEGIPGVLSPDADCGVIWLHTPRIHIRFFGAHVVVLFLGTHTSKAQRPSTSDKFFGSLGALNITYSMFIQMGHAIRDVVIVTYKGGSSSLVPPSPLRTSCCS